MDGDTQQAPYGWGAWASRATGTTGGACIKAWRKLRDKVLLIAAHLLKEAPEDLDIKGSRISSKRDARKAVSFQEVADVAIRFSARLPQGMEPGLDVISFYEPEAPTTCSYATHLAVVAVDAETGFVNLLKYFIVDDSGVIVNPMTAHGQVHGALAHGIGGAMFEELFYDGEGQLLSSTFVDYLLPTASVMPEVIVDSIETPSLTLAGVKGLGEGGAIPAAGARAEAFWDVRLAAWGGALVMSG